MGFGTTGAGTGVVIPGVVVGKSSADSVFFVVDGVGMGDGVSSADSVFFVVTIITVVVAKQVPVFVRPAGVAVAASPMTEVFVTVVSEQTSAKPPVHVVLVRLTAEV